MNDEIQIEKISCGLRHSLLLTSKGEVMGFGDNSSGQLISKDVDFSVIKRPKFLATQKKLKNATNIHTGDKFSAITIQQREDTCTREMYGWGGKNMVDMHVMRADYKGQMLS